MNNPVILFRSSLTEEEEMSIAVEYFDVFERRAMIEKDDLVIARYSALPFYQELEADCTFVGAKLANTYAQHRYIADLSQWYQDLKEFTPKTWFSLDSVDQDAPYIVKGETNSRKNLWKTHMYCPTRTDLFLSYFNLQDDSLIGQQNICIRKFEEFVSYGEQITGQPITKEFRFFVWKGTILAGGYYWANQPEVIEQFSPNAQEAIPFVEQIVKILRDKLTFYVIDVAQRTDGMWRVVELNDGQMSGLSTINPVELYSQLKMVLE